MKTVRLGPPVFLLTIGMLPLLLALVLSSCGGDTSSIAPAPPGGVHFLPEHGSLRSHQVPEWFHDAKLGIFIHWGPASVPGWAPLTGAMSEVVKKYGWAYWFRNCAYADWYQNSMRINGSPTYVHHRETYGEDFPYDDFIPMFTTATQAWDPDVWAAFFQRVGANYVVFVAKHHEGFLLWPSTYQNPHKKNYASQRDIVGELAKAVRARGMKMGLYYSGGLDVTFNNTIIENFLELFLAIPAGREYADYVDYHWHELVERYRPSLLWNDIACPADAHLFQLFADYYNTVPEGVINNRWGQDPITMLSQLGIEELDKIVLRFLTHFDFTTPEYTSLAATSSLKWEATRGIGYSFAYNREEDLHTDHLLSVDELVDTFVDIVSKNGNLLLNVGPRPDGTIPEPEVERLEGLGQWLEVNGDAIFGTRPWVRAEGSANGGSVRVRFTKKEGEDVVYAILLDRPEGRLVTIASLSAARDMSVRLLGDEDPLQWEQDGTNLTILLPHAVPTSPAYSLRLTPQPTEAH